MNFVRIGKTLTSASGIRHGGFEAMNPSLQLHWKLPSVFVQSCSHGNVSEHSFISVSEEKKL